MLQITQHAVGFNTINWFHDSRWKFIVTSTMIYNLSTACSFICLFQCLYLFFPFVFSISESFISVYCCFVMTKYEWINFVFHKTSLKMDDKYNNNNTKKRRSLTGCVQLMSLVSNISPFFLCVLCVYLGSEAF